MIFILLAIIILIVSFAVALVSLVREQHKFERGINFQKEEEEPHKTKADEAQKVTLNVNGKAYDEQLISATGDLENKNYEPTTQKEEPFPWEDHPAVGADNTPEELAEISQIHSKIAQRVSGSQTNKISVDDSAQNPDRLTGEIPLSGHRKDNLDEG